MLDFIPAAGMKRRPELAGRLPWGILFGRRE
jgi:hypothetical protein